MAREGDERRALARRAHDVSHSTLVRRAAPVAAIAGGMAAILPVSHAVTHAATALNGPIVDGGLAGVAVTAAVTGLVTSGYYSNREAGLKTVASCALTAGGFVATGALIGIAGHDFADGIAAGGVAGSVVGMAGWLGSASAWEGAPSGRTPHSIMRRVRVPAATIGAGLSAGLIGAHTGIYHVPDPGLFEGLAAGSLGAASLPAAWSGVRRLGQARQARRAAAAERSLAG